MNIEKKKRGKIDLHKKKINFIQKKSVESKRKEKKIDFLPKEVKILAEKPKATRISQNLISQSKKIKKKKKNNRKLNFSIEKPLKNLKTSSTFLFPQDSKTSDDSIPQNDFNFLKNEQKQILNDLMNSLSLKYNDECQEGEKEKIVKRISEKLIETLNLIDEALKQEYDNRNQNCLLNLLKEGYGKYIGSIMKIFEAHQPYLSEIFSNFNQKLSDIYNKIKNYFFHRYLSIDKNFLKQFKEDLKTDQTRKKSLELMKSRSFSFTEDEFLKEILGDQHEMKNSDDSQTNEIMKNDNNFNDENLEIRHFRKKFCVKIARILQTQYGYEKQKSHDITIKIEKKLRKEFPLMNSDYKTNGILLLNLLKVYKNKKILKSLQFLKNNSTDILKLTDDLEELDITKNENNETGLKDKRSNSV